MQTAKETTFELEFLEFIKALFKLEIKLQQIHIWRNSQLTALLHYYINNQLANQGLDIIAILMGVNRETVKSKSKRTVKTEAATEVFYKKRCS